MYITYQYALLNINPKVLRIIFTVCIYYQLLIFLSKDIKALPPNFLVIFIVFQRLLYEYEIVEIMKYSFLKAIITLLIKNKYFFLYTVVQILGKALIPSGICSYCIYLLIINE